VNFICNTRVGRICLHVLAMIGDGQAKWHFAGIKRELSAIG
jgi:hypothetical protein